MSAKSGITQESLREKYKRIAEFPFDSERKRMSVLVTSEHGRMACTKGAPDVLLQHCSYILWDGKVIPFTSTLKQKVISANEGMAKSALRVLGLLIKSLRAVIAMRIMRMLKMA